MAKDAPAASIAEYISTQSPEIQPKLQEIYNIIKEAAPQATEKISWGMPTFVLQGNLVHFAASKKHIGFYPGLSGVQAFGPRLQEYNAFKGTIQIPYTQPLPKQLIQDIVAFRIKENTGQL